jgi:hypothetical protein
LKALDHGKRQLERRIAGLTCLYNVRKGGNAQLLLFIIYKKNLASFFLSFAEPLFYS